LYAIFFFQFAKEKRKFQHFSQQKWLDRWLWPAKHSFFWEWREKGVGQLPKKAIFHQLARQKGSCRELQRLFCVTFSSSTQKETVQFRQTLQKMSLIFKRENGERRIVRAGRNRLRQLNVR
jgi:hypothetical protein